jgi:hypothetical protein
MTHVYVGHLLEGVEPRRTACFMRNDLATPSRIERQDGCFSRESAVDHRRGEKQRCGRKPMPTNVCALPDIQALAELRQQGLGLNGATHIALSIGTYEQHWVAGKC